jgi:hypothetical protein
MAECITAQITANRKALLAQMSTSNGDSFTPAAVEEQRLMLKIGSRYPYMQLLLGEVTPQTENNNTEDTPLDYLILLYDIYNDESEQSQEIAYKYRNAVADITKKWMSDRTCGGLAQGTKRMSYDNGTVISNNKGDLFFVVAVHFQVQVLIDSTDPYQL